MKRNLTLILFCLGLLPSLTACADRYPPAYSAEAITATVIDADTRKPLAGVVVTANWQLLGGMEGNYPVGQLEVLETVTDANGRFHFPAWGPKKRPKGYLREDDPQLLLFKPGYEYRRLANEVSSRINYDSVRRSVWNGKTIELKRFRGTMEAYENQFELLNGALGHIVADGPEECYWKKLPNTIRAMNRERLRLVARGVNPHTLSTVDKRLLMNDEYFTKKGGCGSPKQFFGDIRP